MDKTHFIYQEYSFDSMGSIPFCVTGCVVMLCTGGRCTLVTGIEEIEIKINTSIMFFVGTTIRIKECSEDFFIKYWEIDEDIYHEISSVIPPAFEYFLVNMPSYEHTPDEFSYRYAKTSMDMAKLLYAESTLPSANERIKMFAKSYMLYLFDYIKPYLENIIENSTTQQQLYRRFISDIYQFCEKEHQLQFYASRLCISVRYLSEIVLKHGNGETAKQLINKQLLFKINTLLSSSDMTISQIADTLHFPDQSYLSRFYKRYMGYYPSEHRNRT